jgi:2-(1,2-epoxy-1,2-dihydrophenyl)acetyl-CoA isomerase
VSEEEPLSLDVDEGLATITLRRPEAMNAFNLALKERLAVTLAEVADREDVRAVLITGEGRAFCAGSDITEMEPGRAPITQRKRMMFVIDEIIVPITEMEKPVVAAVNGHAHGLGFSLALACDLLLASDRAQFSFAFSRVGLAPDAGAASFLVRRVPIQIAKELLFTGRRLKADEALALGLLNRVVPDAELMTQATALARELAAGPTLAFGLTKRLLDQAALLPLAEVGELESVNQAMLVHSRDFAAATEAFLAKRSFAFEGR